MNEGCYLAEIRLFAGTKAPAYWAFCDGSLLSIAEYNQLFNIISTIYGGDGQTTFALPDLRGRAGVGAGQGTNLSTYTVGQQAGNTQVMMNPSQVPTHTHRIQCNGTAPDENTPASNFPAIGLLKLGQPIDQMYATTSDSTQMNAAAVSPAGGGTAQTPIAIVQPSLVLNYIICTNGLFPIPSPSS